MFKHIISAAILASLASPVFAAQTELKIYNGSNNPVKVFVTLNPSADPNPGFLQDVTQLPWRHPVDMKVLNGNGLTGRFELRNGDTASMTTPVGQSFSGKLTFGEASGATSNDVNVTVNNNTAAFGVDQKEFAGIDTTTGNNSKVIVDLTGPNWPTPSLQNDKLGFVSPVAGVERPAQDNPGVNSVSVTFTKLFK